jgi:hypothetical protein
MKDRHEQHSKEPEAAPPEITETQVGEDAAVEIRRRHALREAALRDGPTREALYPLHPVVCNTLRVITKPLQEAYAVAEQVIVHRDPGTCLIADSRIGKTEGIRILRDELSATFPSVPIGVVNAKGHDRPSELAFFGDILEDYQHAGALSGTAADRRRRLHKLWESAARSTDSDRYVLFVDEGQNWGESEYTWLRDASNFLQSRGINVISIIFAHPALSTFRQHLQSRHRTDLVGRFLLRPRNFRGLRDCNELRHTLSAYDSPTLHEFPHGSAISMTEFFMPSAFSSGWRLSSEAALIWSAFENIAQRTDQKATNVGMQWVNSAVRSFLFANYDADSAAFGGNDGTWLSFVEASGYESSLW